MGSEHEGEPEGRGWSVVGLGWGRSGGLGRVFGKATDECNKFGSAAEDGKIEREEVCLC